MSTPPTLVGYDTLYYSVDLFRTVRFSSCAVNEALRDDASAFCAHGWLYRRAAQRAAPRRAAPRANQHSTLIIKHTAQRARVTQLAPAHSAV